VPPIRRDEFLVIAGGEKKVRFFYASKFFTTNSEAFTAKDKEQAFKALQEFSF
jgi:hypothetical protein